MHCLNLFNIIKSTNDKIDKIDKGKPKKHIEFFSEDHTIGLIYFFRKQHSIRYHIVKRYRLSHVKMTTQHNNFFLQITSVFEVNGQKRRRFEKNHR